MTKRSMTVLNFMWSQTVLWIYVSPMVYQSRGTHQKKIELYRRYKRERSAWEEHADTARACKAGVKEMKFSWKWEGLWSARKRASVSTLSAKEEWGECYIMWWSVEEKKKKGLWKSWGITMSFLSVLNDTFLWVSQAITSLNGTCTNRSLPIGHEDWIWEPLKIIGHTGVHRTK